MKDDAILTVSRKIAAAISRLQLLANVAAQGSAPAVARVDLWTWQDTLETSAEEQEAAETFIAPPDIRSPFSFVKIAEVIAIRADFGNGPEIRHYRRARGGRLERITDDEWGIPKVDPDDHIDALARRLQT